MSLEYVKSWAWDFLMRCEIYELPIDIISLREKKLGFDIMSYSEGWEQIKYINKEEYAKQRKGFIADVDGDIIIFYDDNLCMAARNLTVTHEVGHYVCGHITNGKILGKYNFDNTPIYNLQQELEANIFETAFLAPAPILLKLGVKTPTEISRVTMLPESKARIIIEDIKKEAAIRQSSGVAAKLTESFDFFIKSYKNGGEKVMDNNEKKIVDNKNIQTEEAPKIIETVYVPVSTKKNKKVLILSVSGVCCILLIISILFSFRFKNENTLAQNIDNTSITAQADKIDNSIITQTDNSIAPTTIPANNNSAPTSTSENTETNELQVTMTKSGSKYHLSTCRYVNDTKSVFTIPISEAKEKGYEACSICKPN